MVSKVPRYIDTKTNSCGCGYGPTKINVVNNAYPGTRKPHVKFGLDLSSNWFLVAKTISCGCDYDKYTQITHIYIELLMFTQLLGECMPNFGLFGTIA